MNPNPANPDYRLSLWALDAEGEFIYSAPDWETADVAEPVARAAYAEMTLAVARVLCGPFAAFNFTLDKMDADGRSCQCELIRQLC